MTGRRFCICPRPLHLAGVGEARQPAFIAPRKVVWDRDAIVNQRLVCGRSRPCFWCHTERFLLRGEANRAASAGNRAPLHIGHHFMNYGGGAYNEALNSFARAVCGLPEVRCVTYAKLADFMDQQNSETLAAYRRGDFAHVATPTLKVAQRSR
ncbi:MAG TPA: hypothetical protein VFI58_00785 [Xanthobacteraceae bacterium]|jgi:hypothetical protein|nr:hypothetical protein [Xanthobacteraceae bacterium]